MGLLGGNVGARVAREGCKGRELLKLLVSERKGKVARDARCARVICESQSG